MRQYNPLKSGPFERVYRGLGLGYETGKLAGNKRCTRTTTINGAGGGSD